MKSWTARCSMLSGAGQCTLPADHDGSHRWMPPAPPVTLGEFVRTCRTVDCRRAARAYSPYCDGCFAAAIHGAFGAAAARLWPTDAEINDMERERHAS